MGTWLALLVLPSADEGMHRGCSREATLKRVRFGCFVSRVLGEIKNSFCASEMSGFYGGFLDSIMNESRDIIDSRPSRLLFIGLAKESDLSYLSYSKE